MNLSIACARMYSGANTLMPLPGAKLDGFRHDHSAMPMTAPKATAP
jgi:hypothetical protein